MIMGKYEELFTRYLDLGAQETASRPVPPQERSFERARETVGGSSQGSHPSPTQGTTPPFFAGGRPGGFMAEVGITPPPPPQAPAPSFSTNTDKDPIPGSMFRPAPGPRTTPMTMEEQRAQKEERALFDRGIKAFNRIPKIEYGPELEIKSTSFVAEQFRTLRTHYIQFVNNTGCKFLVMTSCHHGEGKTTTAINLARYLAKNPEARVLLIDGDMRRPKIKEYLASLRTHIQQRDRSTTEKVLGIEDYLHGFRDDTGRVFYPTLADCTIHSAADNLWIMPSVHATSQAAELMESGRLTHLFEETQRLFDYIVIDTSPILSTTDPAILGAKIGYVTLVVRCDHTQRETVQHAANLFQQIGVRVLGAVLTHMRQYIPKYFYRYQYFQGYYYDTYYVEVQDQGKGEGKPSSAKKSKSQKPPTLPEDF